MLTESVLRVLRRNGGTPEIDSSVNSSQLTLPRRLGSLHVKRLAGSPALDTTQVAKHLLRLINHPRDRPFIPDVIALINQVCGPPLLICAVS